MLICRMQGWWFSSKVGHIGPKWDKSGAFSDQISVHFGAKPTIPGRMSDLGPKWDKSETFSDLILVHFGAVSQNALNVSKYDTPAVKRHFSC